ncbi:MAG TPA: hypothetical protein VN636_10640, partial [Acidimicrobiia bacterium]|nr:hypothetical protein [Acidimicrobiia bacterium]
LDREPSDPRASHEPDPETRALYADRHVQFEAAYAALLPIDEALSSPAQLEGPGAGPMNQP